MTVEQQSGHDGSGRVTPRAVGPGVPELSAPWAASRCGVWKHPETWRTTFDVDGDVIAERTNLNLAYERVVSNGGAGVDGMTVDALKSGDIARTVQQMIGRLLDGGYQPQPVRGCRSPPGGGQRQLGIPTVVDRLVQQAISQILTRS
jgi:RNA-directed DNA polymerase